MKSARIGITAALLLVASAALSQGSDWSRYKPSRLGDIIAESKASQKVDPKEADMVSGAASYRVLLRFTGFFRPIDATSRGFIRAWLKVHGLPESHLALFDREACFEEGSETYWLPIQTSLVTDLGAERNVGAELPVYLVWLGSIGNHRFFFIINGLDDAK